MGNPLLRDTVLLILADHHLRHFVRGRRLRALRAVVAATDGYRGQGDRIHENCIDLWRVGLIVSRPNEDHYLRYHPSAVAPYIVLLADTKPEAGKSALLTVVARWDREDE